MRQQRTPRNTGLKAVVHNALFHPRYPPINTLRCFWLSIPLRLVINPVGNSQAKSPFPLPPARKSYISYSPSPYKAFPDALFSPSSCTSDFSNPPFPSISHRYPSLFIIFELHTTCLDVSTSLPFSLGRWQPPPRRRHSSWWCTPNGTWCHVGA